MSLDEQSPLIQGIVSKDIDFIRQELSKKETDINSQTDFGLTPLHMAVLCNFKEAIDLLLQNKRIQTNITDSKGLTPLALAMKLGLTDIWLLFYKYQKQGSNNDIDSPELIHWMQWSGNIQFLQMLKSLGKEIDETDETGLSPLVSLALTDNLECLKFIISECHPDINKVYDDGKTIFHLLAVKANCERALAYLLTVKKANPNVLDDEGQSPLHLAVDEKILPNINVMLNSPIIDKNILNEDELSPFQTAIQGGNAQVLACFTFAEGVNKKIRGPNGEKAIMLSPKRGVQESFWLVLLSDPEIELDEEFLRRDEDPLPDRVKELIEYRNRSKK